MNNKPISHDTNNKLISYSLIATQLFYSLSIPFSYASTSQDDIDPQLQYSALISEFANAISTESNNDGNVDEAIKNKMLEYINRETENYLRAQTSNWLSQYGTASFDIEIDQFSKLKSGEIDLLVPFFSSEQGNAASTWFIQSGAVFNNDSTYDGRKFVHLGLGYRTKGTDSFLGINAFYDYDLTRSHQRASLGAEYARQYFKLSSNYYFPLSGWKESTERFNSIGNGVLLEERAAQGVDFNFSGYLPKLPWLSFDTTYQQFFGDNIEMSNGDDPIKNPFIISSSLGFQPIPLFAIRTGYTYEKGGDAQFELGLDLMYRFGIPFEKQLAYSEISALKNLEFQLLDLVDRDHNIRLEYREATTPVDVNFKMTEILVEELTSLPLSTFLNITGDISQIQRLVLGGTARPFIQSDNSIIAPVFINNPIRNGNSYTLTAEVTLKNGTRKSASSPATVRVTENKIVDSQIKPTDITNDSVANPGSQEGMVGEGADAGVTVSVTVRNKDGRPISGKEVIFSTQALGSRFQKDNVITDNNGKARNTLYSEKEGPVTYTLTVDTFNSDGTAHFTSSNVIPSSDKSIFKVPTTLVADDTPRAITLNVKDINGNPLSVKGVRFTALLNGLPVTAGITLRQDDIPEDGNIPGFYSTELRGTITGNYTIVASITDVADFKMSMPITLTLSATATPDSGMSTFGPLKSEIEATGSDSTMLVLDLQDKSGNALPGFKSKLKFALLLNGAAIASGPTSGITLGAIKDSNGVYFASVKGTKVGVLTINASVDGDTTFTETTSVKLIADKAAAPSQKESKITFNKTSIPATGTVPATLTLALKDINANPISGKEVVLSATIGNKPATSTDITLPGYAKETPAGSGIYTATLTATSSGLLTVTAQVTGVNNFKVSADITLEKPIAHAGNSQFEASILEINANDLDATTLTLTLKDQFKEPLLGRTVSLEFSPSFPSAITLTDDGTGVYTASLKGTKAGVYTIKPIIDGTVLNKSITVTLKAGAISDADSTIDPLAPVVTPGTPTVITLKLMDKYNNPISTPDVTFDLTQEDGTTVAKPDEITASAVNPSGGTYTVTVIGKKTGKYNIIAKVSGTKIKTSVITVSSVNSQPSIEKSTMTPTSATLETGKQTSLTLNLKDEFSNSLESKVVLFGVYLNNNPAPSTDITVIGKNNGDGTYTATVSAKKIGNYEVRATISSNTVFKKSSTVTVTAPKLIPSPNLSKLKATTLTVLGGETLELKLNLRDENKNPVPGEAANIRITPYVLDTENEILKGLRLENIVEDPEAGNYTIRVKSDLGFFGNVTFRIRMNGNDAVIASAGAGFRRPTPALSKNSATSVGNAKLTPNTPASSKAEKSTSSYGISAIIKGFSDYRDDSVKAPSAPAVKVIPVGIALEPATPEVVVIVEIPKPMEPNSVPASTNLSYLSISNASILADGKDLSVLTLTLRDNEGNPLLNEEVVFQAFSSDNSQIRSGVTISETENEKDGRYSVILKGTLVDHITIKAVVLGASDFEASSYISLEKQ